MKRTIYAITDTDGARWLSLMPVDAASDDWWLTPERSYSSMLLGTHDTKVIRRLVTGLRWPPKGKCWRYEVEAGKARRVRG